MYIVIDADYETLAEIFWRKEGIFIVRWKWGVHRCKSMTEVTQQVRKAYWFNDIRNVPFTYVRAYSGKPVARIGGK